MIYSGIVTSAGRQGLLMNRCRNPDQTGLGESGAAAEASSLISSLFFADGNASFLFLFLSATVVVSSPGGGDDTNRSFRVRLPESLLFLLLFFSAVCRSGNSRRRGVRPSKVRSVLRRRSWMRGLEVGLGAGTPHWVAMSLNFCNITIAWEEDEDWELKYQKEGGEFDGYGWEGKGFLAVGCIVLSVNCQESNLAGLIFSFL